ncbi:MAG TPA: PilZ domain-containing protein [Clostridiales bacterium]|nr:PilZ domain-containing protein [Clostridiales bacterium]
MKIFEIDTENKLIIKFNHNDRIYSFFVSLLARSSGYIVIPSILKNNEVVDPGLLKDAEIIYTVKDGVFRFPISKLQPETFKGLRVYYTYSEGDVALENRREAYRVFIGEIVTVLITNEDGRRKNVEGILKDLSVTGMGVISKMEFEEGTLMQIVFNFEGVNFFLSGRIVRKEKIRRFRAFSYGVKFDSPNYNIQRIIMVKQIRSKKIEDEQE